MTKVEDYCQKLRKLDNWQPYLLKNSGLPGPRGNLELAQAVAELATKEQAEALVSIPREKAPENSAEVFLVFCGLTALGRRAARGQVEQLQRLREYASDSRWRVREAVAIGLQYVGDEQMPLLLKETDSWSEGNWYEMRAAAAALAEPRLLKDMSAAKRVLHILDKITARMRAASDRRDESFKVLRQSMGYCWSVAVAALPKDGKRLMEKWMKSSDADIQWMMRENLKKSRLQRMDDEWVKSWQTRMEKSRYGG